MNVLLIGFGSIGKRHFEIIKGMDSVECVDLVTRQDIEGAECFLSLQDMKNISLYDYFIVASETDKHFDQLKYICSQVTNKKILVEKPLYSQKHKAFNINANHIYVGYNLRFHPVLQRLKKLLENQEVYYASVMCGQYLPTWRPERDYRASYSAEIKRGGGVLRDLSHEIDYAQWLFGEFVRMHSISLKRSDLEIHSDDIFTAVGVTEKKVVINVTLDYISKHPIRKLIIHAQDLTIEADVIKGSIIVSNKLGKVSKELIDNQDRDYTYAQMHEAAIKGEADVLCRLADGMKVMAVLDRVHFEELE